MNTKKVIRVENLPLSAGSGEISDFFSRFGIVDGVLVAVDHTTGCSLGFAFVEMKNSGRALAEVNGVDFQGRSLLVNESDLTFDDVISRYGHSGADEVI